MKTLIPILCAVLLLVQLGGEIHEWTNIRGQKIQAEFISATNEAVTISMKGKTYVVKLADLTPQSRALAAKLRVQKSKVQKPGAKVEAPKVVVDWDHLEERDDLMYFEEKPFTGVAVKKRPNGQKWWEHTFKDGKMDGLGTYWHKNGQKAMEVTPKDGKQHGLETWWYETGQKKYEGTYKDGELISEKRWDEDGKPERPPSQDRSTTKPEAEAPKVVVDYEKLELRDGLFYFERKPFTGFAVKKYPNGQKLWEGIFKDGKLDGLVTLWYSNGQKKKEFTFKDGKKVGLSTYWYENGQKGRETTYKDGKRDGLSTWWHENGKVSDEITYQDGKRHGLYTLWQLNGQKESEVTYKDGKMDGLATRWYENGQKSEEATLKDGIPISRKIWDRDGNPMGQDQEGGDQKPETKVEAPKPVVEAPKVVVDWDGLEERRDGFWYFEGKPFTGVVVEKYPNGQKEYEGTFKDGKLHGLGTEWYENGQKSAEFTLKDGKLISEKRWDEDGNPE